ncbi:response regulator [Spirochaeta thermophila]|uniref:Response regulatory domain-containing protein n=1 Tax=Winmispira thermophila (strain ATCC 49972 / DSM 6192 / RI 19.B1) TaxID=665571 RepID=E0RT59_WINT6|nr:response regulator [Spirochaeta thermophila]ADN02355.1 hypothetical protein STHERM_c14150 [Spirochaeta thermophila DSM 6192]
MKLKGDLPVGDQAGKFEGRKPDGTPYKILIADDSIFVTKQLRQILSSAGFEVIGEANTGDEAVELYKSLHPGVDLVTLDITMPRMDGITALKKIMEFDADARVVIISALGRDDLVKTALLEGAKNFIVKPLNREKVLERILIALR